MLDILIKNGEVIDGLGKTPKRKLDVGIESGKITELTTNIPVKKAKKVIDATGSIVAPGFIDIQNHSDSYWTLFDEPQQLAMISQGITTIVVGNCGSSVAPLPTTESIKTIQKWHNLAGINLNWTTFKEFLEAVDGKTSVNVASLVGHSTLRRGLLADQVRQATADEIKIMCKLLSESMAEGAFGLSLGLMYAHEVNSSKEELSELAKIVSAYNGYLSVHLRSESNQILESIDEVIELAAHARVPLKISHLKIRGEKNWNLSAKVLTKLQQLFQKGLNTSFDIYPYDTSWSVLYTYLPKWAYEGGRSEIIKVIEDKSSNRKILDYLKSQQYDYAKITVGQAWGNPGFIGKTITQIAENSGITPDEALLSVLKACGTQVMVVDNNLSADQIEQLIHHPLSMIATDGAGYSRKTTDLVHPRCFGAMPRFLKLVREKGLISLELAINKITGEPAKLLSLTDRGVIAKNAYADITVFDPSTIEDKATYQNPFEISVGINHVLVNGKLAFEDRNVMGLYGRTLKKK